MKQTIKPGFTPPEWNPEALWAKSLRYAEMMLERKDIDWEHAFWSSLLLEHLARAALANVHPILVAEARRSGISNQLYALGLPIKESKFSPKSIPISEVFSRLKELFDDFTSEDMAFCNSHMNLRNSEIHTGKAAFDGHPVNSWEPKFYKVCSVLLGTMELNLMELLGQEEAEVAEQLILAETGKSSAETKEIVEAHQKIWQAKSDDDKEVLSQRAINWATKQSGHRVDCPACASKALVFGEAVGEIKVTLEDDMVVERQNYSPSAFECVACNLKIPGLSKLAAVGLGDRFTNTYWSSPEDYYAIEEPDWGNFEEDNNEPF